MHTAEFVDKMCDMAKRHTSDRSQNFAQAIRKWMGDKGLSLKEAAKVADVDYRLLQRWASKGISRTNASTEEPLRKLARAMEFKGTWKITDVFLNAWMAPWDYPNRKQRKQLARMWNMTEAVLRFADHETFWKLHNTIVDTYNATVEQLRRNPDPDPEEAGFLKRLGEQKTPPKRGW